MTLELKLMTRPVEEPQVRQHDRFTTLTRKAMGITRDPLNRESVPTDSVKVGVWSQRLGIGYGLFEYLLYIGSRDSSAFEDFQSKDAGGLVNYNVPRALHNAGVMVRGWKDNGIPREASGQIHLAKMALELTNPDPAQKNGK